MTQRVSKVLAFAGLSLLLATSSWGQSGSWPIAAGGQNGASGQHTTIDADGNVYVAGGFRGTAPFGSQQLFSAGNSDVYVAKYDAFGSLIWVVSAGGAQADEVGGITVDDSQNAYITVWIHAAIIGVQGIGGGITAANV